MSPLVGASAGRSITLVSSSDQRSRPPIAGRAPRSSSAVTGLLVAAAGRLADSGVMSNGGGADGVAALGACISSEACSAFRWRRRSRRDGFLSLGASSLGASTDGGGGGDRGTSFAAVASAASSGRRRRRSSNGGLRSAVSGDSSRRARGGGGGGRDAARARIFSSSSLRCFRRSKSEGLRSLVVSSGAGSGADGRAGVGGGGALGGESTAEGARGGSAPSSLVPHPSQNLKPGSTRRPQFGQVLAD